jgi:hypothetical protein
MNNLLGTKFKIVLGYKSTMEIDIAMERGEVQARTGSYTALASEHPDWLKENKVVILCQIGGKPDPLLPKIPMMTDFATREEDRQVIQLISSPIALGRPYLAPPEVPADRLAILRTAYHAAMRDPGFLAEAKKMDIEIDPVSAEEITKTVNDTINASPAIIAKAKTFMGGEEAR